MRHHHHHHHNHGRREGHGRFVDQGDLRAVVLALIGEQPRHGYDLIRAIEARTGGAYAPSPGVIYPTLQVLEDMGHIALAPETEGKKTYAITEPGRAALEANRPQIDDVLSRLHHRGRRHANPRIAASLHDLKSAVRSCLEALTETGLDQAATAIDEAAARIRALRDSVAGTDAEH